MISVLEDMDRQTRRELIAEGLAEEEITSIFEVDVRYAGQAFEVPLVVDLETLKRDGIPALQQRFNAEHLRLFTFNMPTEHEIVNLRAVALGHTLDLPAAVLPEGDGNPIAAKLRDHELWMDGRTQSAIIYDRSKLRAGDRIAGAAVIVEMDSTTLIETGCVGTVDPVGNILIEPA
jgi:N-methylhydantoinase A